MVVWYGMVWYTKIWYETKNVGIKWDEVGQSGIDVGVSGNDVGLMWDKQKKLIFSYVSSST